MEGTTFNSAPVSGWTVTVVLCLTGHCSRAVSGRPAPLGRCPSASLAETPETHEEDVPDAHRGKPSAPPCGGPRPVHRWVHAQTEGAFLLRWPRWPRKAGVHYLCPSSVEQVMNKQVGHKPAKTRTPSAETGDGHRGVRLVLLTQTGRCSRSLQQPCPRQLFPVRAGSEGFLRVWTLSLPLKMLSLSS